MKKTSSRNKNASGDHLVSASSQIKFFNLLNQDVNESDEMLGENGDQFENTFVALNEETENENLFTITTDLPANVEADIAMSEIVVPEFVETETLPKDCNHVLPGEDLETNNSNSRSIAVHSLAVEVIEIKDLAENSEKRR